MKGTRTSRIKIHTGKSIYFGNLTYPEDARFSDILCIKAGNVAKDFFKRLLPLTNVEIVEKETEEVSSSSLVYINVSQIMFAYDRGKTAGDDEKKRRTQGIKKRGVIVTMIDNSSFGGEILGGVDSINSSRVFINMTNAMMNLDTILPFVAINKKFIRTIQKTSGKEKPEHSRIGMPTIFHDTTDAT